jgi:hypothetical protein
VTTEESVFREIVLWIVREEARAITEDESYPGEIRSLRESLLSPMPPCNEQQIAGWMPRQGGSWTVDMFDKKAYLYMAPVAQDGHVLPVARLSYDFASDPPKARVQVGLYTMVHAKAQAVGFRLEAPTALTGSHCYWHAQPMRSYDGAGSPTLPSRSMWQPVTIPAFPIDAQGPIGLLICLLISLYGFDVLGKMRGQPFVADLQRVLDGSFFPFTRVTVPAVRERATKIGRVLRRKRRPRH